jgi:hypothetical protein
MFACWFFCMLGWFRPCVEFSRRRSAGVDLVSGECAVSYRGPDEGESSMCFGGVLDFECGKRVFSSGVGGGLGLESLLDFWVL